MASSTELACTRSASCMQCRLVALIMLLAISQCVNLLLLLTCDCRWQCLLCAMQPHPCIAPLLVGSRMSTHLLPLPRTALLRLDSMCKGTARLRKHKASAEL